MFPWGIPMPTLHPFILLATFFMDGGTTALPPALPPAADAGQPLPPAAHSTVDAGTTAPRYVMAEGIRWPTEMAPLATLDGPAILAAHAALQRVLAEMPKEYAKTCSYSAKAMEVVVGQDEGLYFVRIHRRPDRCGRIAPGVNATLDWLELYAVSPEGKVLARFPYHP